MMLTTFKNTKTGIFCKNTQFYDQTRLFYTVHQKWFFCGHRIAQ